MNLRYVDDSEAGIRRRRQGRGFSYFDPRRKRIRNATLLERLKSLVIPPAWEDVWICPDENGHIQATGRDSKGRKQYIYHPEWNEIQSQTKFERLNKFGEALPDIRERIDHDLRNHALIQEKVVALIVQLMEETLIRIGNEEYTRKNKSYGLTTLKDRHIHVNGSKVKFRFNGKKGKQVEVDVADRRLARLVQKCQELPGQRLFQYRNGSDFHPVTSTDVNEYLQEISGEDFTAKDFRTWGASVLAADELDHLGFGESETAQKRTIVRAVKTVADALNNTASVCRKYYIHPQIIEAYQDASLFDAMQKAAKRNPASKYDLEPSEKAVLEIIKNKKK